MDPHLWRIRSSLLALSFLGLSSLSSMFGDIISYQASSMTQSWRLNGGANYQDWRAAISSLNISLLLSPKHPDYLQSKGYLYFWQVLFIDDPTSPTKETSPEIPNLEYGISVASQETFAFEGIWNPKDDSMRDSNASLEEAAKVDPIGDMVKHYSSRQEEKVEAHSMEEGIQLLRQSIQLRPYWPYAWAELADLKAIANEFDNEFYQALDYSEVYGPWERPVIRSLLTTYFRAWNNLNEQAQNRAMALWERTLRLNPELEPDMIEIALRTVLNSPMQGYACKFYTRLLEFYDVIERCRPVWNPHLLVSPFRNPPQQTKEPLIKYSLSGLTSNAFLSVPSPPDAQIQDQEPP